MEEQKQEELIEALLFISGKFLSIEEISSLSGINEETIRSILAKLVEKYKEKVIHIISREGFYKMDVKAEYNFLINKLASGEEEFTKAEQGTLAVIAYKKPVKQSLVIKIRGNKAYEHIKKFMELELLTSKKEGRTYILDLSENFYNYFTISEGRLEELNQQQK